MDPSPHAPFGRSPRPLPCPARLVSGLLACCLAALLLGVGWSVPVRALAQEAASPQTSAEASAGTAAAPAQAAAGPDAAVPQAAEAGPGAGQTAKPLPPIPKFSVSLSEGSSGRVGVTGNQAWYGDLETDLRAKWGVWNAGYERRDFFWNNASRLHFGNSQGTPWETLHRYYVGRDLFRGDYERLEYYAGALADMAFETQPDDALGLGVFGHATVDVYRGFRLGLEGDASAVRVRGGNVLPRFGLRVRLDLPESRLKTWFLTHLGISPENTGRVSFGIEYLRRRRIYRLADNSTVQNKGYVDMNETSIGLPITVRLTPGLDVRLVPRYFLPRVLSFYDSAGQSTSNLRTGHSIGGALEIEWTPDF
ncbi:hypothetical protein dsx2_2920 [Desulfovibrio sp. X2]|uniref:hypothetical protein n=1 Tax=Desulfovibrio sp. X2 TaxID=941449 RepID=UPI000358CD0F|nr:hypothetical protein [Desulfovibrio sp. X2]EPR42133.1 hypothetical protein dsx2_2920 [Desulfovibrio sp. X2]